MDFINDFGDDCHFEPDATQLGAALHALCAL